MVKATDTTFETGILERSEEVPVVVRVRELVDPDLAAWAHHGWLGRAVRSAAPTAS